MTGRSPEGCILLFESHLFGIQKRCIPDGIYRDKTFPFHPHPYGARLKWKRTLPRAKNMPLACFLNALSSPTLSRTKKEEHPIGYPQRKELCCCAREGTRYTKEHPAETPDGNSPPDCCISIFESLSYQKEADTQMGISFFLVRERGLEPPRRNHTHLKRACLPFQHSRKRALIL